MFAVAKSFAAAAGGMNITVTKHAVATNLMKRLNAVTKDRSPTAGG